MPGATLAAVALGAVFGVAWRARSIPAVAHRGQVAAATAKAQRITAALLAHARRGPR